MPAKPKIDAIVAKPSPIIPTLECFCPVWGNEASLVVAASTFPVSLCSTVKTFLAVVSIEILSGRVPTSDLSDAVASVGLFSEASGLSGSTGWSDSSGVSDSVGFSGFSGASGASGFSGSTGTSGSVGSSGLFGSTGFSGFLL